MTALSGLGLIEIALLTAIHELGGTPGAARVPSTRVLDRLEEAQGIGASYAYFVMRDLQAPYRVHLPLLDGEGNWGSQGSDPPADARYTELRLTEVGLLALAAERGEIGPVPLGLIEGSLYRGGSVPPFDPERVVAALQAGTGDAGAPVVATGGPVGGEIDALLAGRPARLQLGSRLAREGEALVVTHVPLGVDIDRLADSLLMRARSSGFRARGDYAVDEPPVERPRSPVIDVWDETSMHTGTRIVCQLAAGIKAGIEVDVAEQWIRSVWPVTIEVDAALPAPMATRLRGWDRGDGSGLAALGRLLT